MPGDPVTLRLFDGLLIFSSSSARDLVFSFPAWAFLVELPQADYEAYYFYRSGRGLITSGEAVTRWDLRTGAEVWSNAIDGDLAYDISEHKGLLLLACDTAVRLMDPDTGQVVWKATRCHRQTVWEAVSLGPLCPGAFASVSTDATMCVWSGDLMTAVSYDLGSGSWSIDRSPCGSMLAVGCLDGSVQVARLPGLEVLWSVPGTETDLAPRLVGIREITFSPNSRLLALMSTMFVTLHCAETGDHLDTIETGHVGGFFFSRNSTRLVLSSDNTIIESLIFPAWEQRIASLCHGLPVDPQTDSPERTEAVADLCHRLTRFFVA